MRNRNLREVVTRGHVAKCRLCLVEWNTIIGYERARATPVDTDVHVAFDAGVCVVEIATLAIYFDMRWPKVLAPIHRVSNHPRSAIDLVFLAIARRSFPVLES